MDDNPILTSWSANANQWISLIENEQIASRKVTNQAILEVILQHNIQSIADIGCGEGWLTRALSQSGMATFGIDGTPELIEKAKQQGGNFHTVSYAEIIKGTMPLLQKIEAAVFNFCLYEDEGTEKLLAKMSQWLSQPGLIFIQTLHPILAFQKGISYQNQWIKNAWEGLPGNFALPHQWYFRTMEGWFSTFQKAGLQLVSVHEPKAKDATLPSSIIFTLTPDSTLSL